MRSLETRKARLGVPSLFLALLLTLPGPAAHQANAEPADHSPSVVQDAATDDTLLASSEAKPCVRKPDNAASAKFVNAGTNGPTAEREPRSLALPDVSSTRTLSLTSRGWGRAPPPATPA